MKNNNIVYKIKNECLFRFDNKNVLILNKDKYIVLNPKASKNIAYNGALLQANSSYESIKTQLLKIGIIEPVSIANSPINITLKITDKCNLLCSHCHSSFGIQEELTLEEIKSLIDEFHTMKVFNINISGGEPLLRSDLFDIISYITKKNIKITMSTNAVLINDEIAKKLFDSGLRQCHVSIDSTNPAIHDAIRGVKGSFDKMISGVNALMKKGIQILGVTVLASQSPEEYEKILLFCREKGFSGHKTNPLIPAGRGKDLFQKSTFYKNSEKYYTIWEKHKKLSNNKFIVTAEPSFIMMFNSNMSDPKDSSISLAGCPAGILTCAVNECGDVLPCSFFTQVNAGNVRKEAFYDIWYKSDIFTQLRLRKFKGICSNCKHKSMCGGCRARAYSDGNINLSDNYCYLSKKH